MRRFVVAASVLCLLAPTACGDRNADGNPAPPDAATGTPAAAGSSAGSDSVAGGDGLPNRDPALFAKAAPCELVTKADLERIFDGSFANVLGTDDSPVTDIRESKRACAYDGTDAKIDHGSSYDITSVSLIITTSIDNEAGVLWQAHLEATKLGSGKHFPLGGYDDAVKLDSGWLVAHKGPVIIEVNDVNSRLTDDGAVSILNAALSRL